MKKKWIVYAVLFLPGYLNAQFDQEAFLSWKNIIEDDQRRLYLSIDNQNLFRNNEFYNAIQTGHTTFGTLLNTTLQYYPLTNLGVEGGIHFLKYYGQESFDRVIPLFRIRYIPMASFEIVMGQLFGGLHHGFIEPFYQFERFFSDPPETGLQLLFQSRCWKSDLYINWTGYLKPGSTGMNESYTLGWTNEVHCLDLGSSFGINLFIQGLVTHIGGPQDSINKPVESLLDGAAGIDARWKFDGFFREVGARAYFALYHDLSPSPALPYGQGYGVYPNIYGKTRWFDIYLGYWKGHEFISPLGDPMFSSLSNIDDALLFPERDLFLFKFYFNYQITDGVFIGARYESYLDVNGTIPDEKNMEYNYSYGVYITFNRDFFLSEIRRYK